MSEHVPEIVLNNLGDAVNRRRLEGLFHACRCLRDVEAEFENDENGTNLHEKLFLRERFKAGLDQWVYEIRPPTDADTLPLLRKQLELNFSAVSGFAYGGAIAARFLELWDETPVAFAEQVATFHGWGRDAAAKFWEGLWARGHPPRLISGLVFHPQHPAVMSFRAGVLAPDYFIITSLPFLVPGTAGFDYYRWYMLLPLYFMHEYVSHIYPIDLRNSLFQEGWLLGLAGGFLADGSSKPGILEMPRSHALAFDEFQAMSEVRRPMQDVAMAGYDFYIYSKPYDLQVLMHFAVDLALIEPAPTSSPWERRRAGRFAEIIRKTHKNPLQKVAAMTDICNVVAKAYVESGGPEQPT